MKHLNVNASFDFVGIRKFSYGLSLAVLVISLLSLGLQGLNLGIDFTGGTVLRIETRSDLAIEDLRDALGTVGHGQSQIQEMEKDQYQIKMDHMTQEDQDLLLKDLADQVGEITLVQGDSVGPSMGQEILQKGILALVVAIGLMVAYISFRFEWRFALSGILALVHDIVITLGFFSLLQLEVNAAFIAAILTIFGYSINDSIVVFDRIRENIGQVKKDKLPGLVNYSIASTLRRSIYTSVSTLIPLVAVFALGGETTKLFTLAMIIGISAGAYSSIFVGAPLWLDVSLRSKKKRF